MSHIFDPSNKDRLHSQERQKQLPPGLVLKHLGLHPGSTLLDIGAGTGYFAVPAAAELAPDGKVIAADVSKEMLSTLKERSADEPGRIECLLSGTNHLPLADDVADVILLAFVYHEMDNRKAWLEEIMRLLKPEGRAAIVEWDVVPSPGGPPQDERLPASEVLHLASECGFLTEEKVQLTPYHYLCILRIADT